MPENTNLRCEEVVEQLLTFLDGEVEKGRRSLIERHLEECRSCCSRADFELALRNKVRDAGKRAPRPALRRRIKELVDRF